MADKTFKGNLANPALSFISEASIKAVDGAGQGEQQEQQGQELYTLEQAAEILKKTRGVTFTENKSHKLHLMVTPTLFGEIKAEARRRDTSINAVANEILEQGIKNIKTGKR